MGCTLGVATRSYSPYQQAAMAGSAAAARPDDGSALGGNMRNKRANASKHWDGSERLFDNSAWRDRFGLVVLKEMRPESREDFIRGMVAEGLEVESLADDEVYPAALAYARAH